MIVLGSRMKAAQYGLPIVAALVMGCSSPDPLVGEWAEANPPVTMERALSCLADGRITEKTTFSNRGPVVKVWTYTKVDKTTLELRNGEGEVRRIRIKILGDTLTWEDVASAETISFQKKS